MMEHLNEVERLAGLLFSAHEIGLLTGVDPLTAGDGFEQAMLRGRLREEVQVRASFLELVKAGVLATSRTATHFVLAQ